jgi:D-alanyl-D-alanine endopeptidase (penicillin-binding protein 7)
MKKYRCHIVYIVLLTAPVQAQKSTPVRPQIVAVVHDVAQQKNIHSVNADRAISIASMTKLVAALALLESGQNLTEKLTVRGRDRSPRIRPGLQMSRYDLLELSMVSSDNLAARTLIEHYPGGYNAGLEAMNNLVRRIGAVETTLVEPTGIMAANISTANDIVRITKYAASWNVFETMANLNQSRVGAERVNRARAVVQWIVGNSTNPFLAHPNEFRMLVAKTGYTTAAGFCLTMAIEYRNRKYILVTAGHANKQSRKNTADELVRQITEHRYKIIIDDAVDADDQILTKDQKEYP